MPSRALLLAAATALLPACGAGPCQTVARERAALTHRRATAVSPHARVQLPYAMANRLLADALVDAPEIPLRLHRLGRFQRLIGDLRAVPTDVRIGPGARNQVHFDLRVELRDRRGELIALDAGTEVTPVLERRGGDVYLSAALGASEVNRIEPELGPRARERLGRALRARLPALVRDRLPAAVVDELAAAALEEATAQLYRLLRRPLLARLGARSRVEVRLPDLPIAHVEVASLGAPEPALEVAVFTTLPVRAGVDDRPPPPEHDRVGVQLAGSTVAELANWAIASGHAPQRYTRKMKPARDGAYQPAFDWRAEDRRRPLVVHLFQIEGGCSHFRVGARPDLAVRGDDVVATLCDRKLEQVQGPALVELLARVQQLVSRSVDRSRRAAAHVQVTVAGRRLETRLTRASVSPAELRFALTVDASPRTAVLH